MDNQTFVLEQDEESQQDDSSNTGNMEVVETKEEKLKHVIIQQMESEAENYSKNTEHQNEVVNCQNAESNKMVFYMATNDNQTAEIKTKDPDPDHLTTVVAISNFLVSP